MTFTEKTKCLFAINKGLQKLIKNDPYKLNDLILEEDRRIPFTNIIYIGDGPSDVPCFSIVKQNGGIDIGIMKGTKPYERMYKERKATYGPYLPNYSKNSSLRRILESKIYDIARDIKDRWEQKFIRRAPRHS